MRLQTIELTNFGSFANASLDLRSISACTVTGPNGAGKSTLCVDSVLWALFGKCRTSTDGMLRLGTDEMSVSVCFTLNGQTYRVTRTRSLKTKTKAGRSELQLTVKRDGDWMPVSGARLADTQAKIGELLNADYDLLIATGVLVQGHADRFSRATSAERKAILAQILRLDQYAELKTGATRAGTVLATKREEKEKALYASSGTELVIDSLKREAATLDERRQRITQERATLERERQTLIEQQARDRASLEALTTIPAQMEKAQARKQDLKTRERALIERRDRLEKILANRVVIEAKVEEEAQTRQRLEDLVEEERRLTTQIEGAAAKIRICQAEVSKGSERALKVNEARQIVESFVRIYQEETQHLQQSLSEIRRQIQEAVTAYQQQTDSRGRSVEQLAQELDSVVDAYLLETERLKVAVEADEQAVKLLGQVPCDAQLQGRCEFTIKAVESQCILEKSRPHLNARFTDREAIKELLNPMALARYWQMLADHAARHTDHEAIAQAGVPDRVMERMATEQSLAGRLTIASDIASVTCPQAVDTVSQLESELEAWRGLQWDQKIAQATTTEAPAKAQRQTVITEQASARVTLTKLAEFTVLVPELQAADRDLEQVNLDMAAVILDLAEVLAAIEQGKAHLAERQALVARLAQTDVDVQESDKRRAAQTAVDQGLAQQAGQVIERIQQAEQDLVTAAELRKELDVLTADVRQYQVLTEAYTVIPVLVLESSIPLLEDEANRILSKISTSGLRVSLETQKTLKSRDGLAETLDIKVRDVFGERLLEAYSGGERARVDLAVRIGLSRLLANRAGARLETLVVDEAFAAVDREGVEQLVECLPMLSEEFPLCLFVTHDESFKSSIAQQIVVHKNGMGSTVEVLA